jgi:BirA family transcriptional regulator, biotin operon repressor / biotin---[acetyl-CoA-carboxylase] ligase
MLNLMSRLGSTLLEYDSLPSTNDLAREMAVAGACEGTAILAREQTKGRGRQGRSWSSPAGEGLYFSVVIRPEIKPAQSPVITLAAAVAVAETLSVDFDVAADIKWPNDVQARGRKICGILVEAAIEGQILQYAVIGIGVNVAQREFSAELKQSATSLFLETGRAIAPDEFLKPLLDRLDYWYQRAVLHPEEIIARWEELSTYALGCRVRIETAGDAFEGVTEGLARNGALKVRLEDGAVREVLSGEVRLRQTNPA